MTTIKRFSLALSFTLFVFVLTVPAQTPAIEVSTDNEAAEFSAQGNTRKVQVEVYAPSGELVFETSDSDGQSIRWGMTNQKGERVADGVYLATITVVDSLGRKRKRIEQVTVSSPQYAAQAASTSAPQDSLAATGAGTAGKIAKWLTPSSLGNSALTEGADRVGVNVAPSATLQVNGVQPAPLAANGANAPVLLQTMGGKGGNTTGTTGQSAGAGASISLVAGNGGDGPSGSLPGKGGNIILQPGGVGAVTGTGVKSGNGNVLLAPSGVGNVGVGTTAPASPLHVVSAGSTPPRLQSTAATSFAAGWDFYHGTAGKGYVGVPGTGVGAPGPGEMLLYGSTGVKTSLWAGGTRAITIAANGRVGIGSEPSSASAQPKLLVVRGTGDSSGLDVFGGPGNGIFVSNTATTGGYSLSAIHASSSNIAVTGESGTGFGIFGKTTSGKGIYGFVAGSGTGFAGYFDGKVQVNGTFINNSDRAAKANVTVINPRTILQKLASVPVQAWNYKTEPESVRHLGPMAQDFRSAFGLGVDDKGISAVDADGVALASIQALYQMMLEKDRQIERQNRRIERLESQLNQVRRAVRRRAGKR